MVQQTDPHDLNASWRALREGGDGQSEGWRTIGLRRWPDLCLLAAVRFPGRDEAILAGFRTQRPIQGDLPEGRGFMVELATGLPESGFDYWLSLTRAPGASLELFQAMSEDMLGLVSRNAGLSEARLQQLFLARIRAWQNFMSKSAEERLSLEAELGLYGELVVLEAMLEAGLDALDAVQAWQGPFDGLHDFGFGAGAIEVKTTLSGAGFPVKISSLEQLDDTLNGLISLAAVRLVLQADGSTLSGQVEALRGQLPGPAGAIFERCLLHAGYRDAHAPAYTRSLVVGSLRHIAVDEALPRLRRSDLPPAIRSASYELDLDLTSAPSHSLTAVLSQFGLL